MKKLLSIPALALLALFASCSSDDAVLPGGADGGRVGVSADIPAIGFEDDTRAALIFSSTGMEFKWQENDVLSIYPKYVEGKDLMFTEETSPREPWYIVSNEVIKQGKDGSWFAFFTDDEGGEILDVPNVTDYLCVIPKNDNTPDLGYTAIPVSYLGQKQASNVKIGFKGVDNDAYMASEKAASAHLTNYNYMYGAATQQWNGATHFDMKYLQATIRLYMQVPDPENVQIFDSLMILHNFVSDVPGYKFTSKGTLNLDTEKFTPLQHEKILTLKFGDNGFDLRDYDAQADEYSATYSDDYKLAKTGKYYIIAYMELFPVNMLHNDIVEPTLYLCGHTGTGDNVDKKYYKASLSKKKIEAGKAYQWTTGMDDEEPIVFEAVSIQEWKEATGYDNGKDGNGTQDW